MSQEQQLNGTEIFVVDDDETMRDTLSAVFVPEGCRVTCFAEGQSFLVAARARTDAKVFASLRIPPGTEASGHSSRSGAVSATRSLIDCILSKI